MVHRHLIGWLNDKLLASIAINPQFIEFPFAKMLNLLKMTAASEQVLHQSVQVAKKRSHLVRSLCEKIIEIVKKEEEKSSDMDFKEMEIEELDSKDEEELKLSDTLIRECIEHLSSGNKTNRHEEDDTGDVVMFESLHPYFDKSSYGRT